ncbi:MAG: sigma-54-dependent Fis family transcriptional regulator [Alphaproteobacteria bacterium]|nr:sigma-54-dependent Fis family transcriptional regulator [Alphaproteobacteria bacterium]
MAAEVLIVDDEADIRDLISDILKDEGYATRIAGSSDEALKAIGERLPSVIVLDIWLQGSELDGLGVLELVKKKHPEVPVIMISGHGNIETAVSAIRIGAFDFIEKPFKEDRLLLVVQRALEHRQLRQENEELRVRAGADWDLIGNSSGLNTIRATIDKVAPTNSRVLISGAAGTGKEVVARLIHAKSRRNKGPFVVLNAASMSPEWIDAELFGQEAKNPTGGAEKVGTFERAHRGTLFIDEVADMPMETQAKILRALQENSFERLHGNRRVEVDVRVIVASNRDLNEEIRAGRFREDLYYRLNVVPLKMPALREHRDDIPELAQHFLKRAAESAGLPARKLSEDALAALQSYDWPGNVRQLRNVMEWLLIMAPGQSKDVIKADMLPADLFDGSIAAFQVDLKQDIMSLPLRDARELFERQYLLSQINRFGGNISKTSSFVCMERSALHRKLKMLGITADEKV